MKLQKARIRNFRSIDDSGEFSLNPRISCFIGKNESGKTNILLALEKLAPDKNFSLDDISYRAAERDSFDTERFEILECHFALEKKDMKWLKKITPDALKIQTLRVRKYSNEDYEIEISDKKGVAYLTDTSISQHEETINNIKKEIDFLVVTLRHEASQNTNFEAGIEQADAGIGAFLDIVESSKDGAQVRGAFKELNTILNNLPSKTPKIDSRLGKHKSSLGNYKNKLVEILGEDSREEKFLKHLPKIRYVKDVSEPVDDVDMNAFIENMDAHPSIRDLAKLANIDIKALKDKSIPERRRSTTRGSSKLSRLFSRVWDQGSIDFDLHADGNTFVIMVEDDTGGYDPPNKRSDGFKWFLAFLTSFHPETKNGLSNTILLLDDPGLNLHPSGQKDLLKVFEEISEKNQIVYSTHSPFLVDKDSLDRVRLVSKKSDKKGSVIVDKFYHSKDDSLAPIRAAIGATVGDSLFFSEKTVIVEGYSDYLILEGMNRYLACLKKQCLDTNKVTILPVGGATKTPYFATLLQKENFRFVVVLDNDKEGRDTVSRLERMNYLDQNRIVKLDEVLGATWSGDASIENLVDSDFYLNSVLKSHRDSLAKSAVTKLEKLRAKKEQVPQQCRKIINESKKRSFDKIRVARHIYENLNEVPEEIKVGKESIELFGKLFTLINKKLES